MSVATASKAAPAAVVKEPITLAIVDGCPPELDSLAAKAPADHAFLRASWFEASGAESCLIARRGGQAVAAFPTQPAGPPQLGARAVAGLYWPFRFPLLAADLDDADLRELLGEIRASGLLGPLWRIGPCYGDDPLARRLMVQADAAGWHLVSRSLGRTWTLDVTDACRQGSWPRTSTRKRLAKYERQLAELGRVEIEDIRGAGWTEQVLADLASVERRSWVGATDRTGAKFLAPQHLAHWRRCIADPVLAELLSATIVRLDGRPIAFSLDVTAGSLQYGIAGAFDQAFGTHRVGRLANETTMIRSAERGVTRFDWGAGDSGYKREAGFDAGSEIVDVLFVRNPVLARLLRRRWANSEETAEDAGRLPLTRREALLLGSLVTASTVAVMAE